jgi:Protein of unknown function with HXXEE motif
MMQTRLLILLAPLIYMAHILEEAPGYMRWVNRIVDHPFPDQGHFFAGNLPSIAITAAIAILAAATLNRAALMVMLAWLSYFMFANAIFHIVATVALRGYSPGTVTAAALYLPYFGWFASYLRTRVPAWAIASVALLFGMPMFIQAYMIIFRGTRFY